jgi:hypothetical protein
MARFTLDVFHHHLKPVETTTSSESSNSDRESFLLGGMSAEVAKVAGIGWNLNGIIPELTSIAQ